MEPNETSPPPWENLIKTRLKNDNFKSRTCKVFNRPSLNHSDALCCCGRLVRSHSFDGDSFQAKAKREKKSDWKPPLYFKTNLSYTAPVTIFGQLKSTGCKFIRLDSQSDMNVVYDFLVDDCGQDHKPTLILSVYGGAKYFIMTEKLEKEIIRGIIDAATIADAWILTAGINTGVSKLVGEGISHYRLLREYPDKVKCIGLTMWGSVNESTRLELKNLSHPDSRLLLERQIPDNVQDEKETIEKNHTHCILFHSGSLKEYLDDTQRDKLVTRACEDDNHKCYAVTIIIEGGTGTLEVLDNEIKARRPIVLIQGSGRLADVLSSLIEQTSHSKQNQQSIPTNEDIEQAFREFFPNPEEFDISEATKSISKILEIKNRYLLNVFSLDRDDDVAKTIFKAIFAAKQRRDEINNANTTKEAENPNQDAQRRTDDFRLVNLALHWNYIEGVLPILQSRQEAMRKKDAECNKEEMECYKLLFKNSLEKNRPKFVEYILAAGFDPRTLIEINDTTQREQVLSNLYKNTYHTFYKFNKSHAKRVQTLFGEPTDRTVKHLDGKLNKLVGSFIGTIYAPKEDDFRRRICIDMRNHVCTCCKPDQTAKTNSSANQDKQHHQNDNDSTYSKDEWLRNLFIWSIFMDMPEMGKTILAHLQSRICAALIASAIFKRYAKSSTTVDQKEKFQDQSLEFVTYAAQFIDKCYEYNERLACELLLREIPLFGDVSCIQVAISSEAQKLVRTYSFDQALSQVWYNKLSIENHQTYARPLQLLSILTFGLLAPMTIPYRDEETRTNEESLSSDGIQCYINKKASKPGPWNKYWSRFLYFHDSPMIKMCYHFISYIWFLLVFSYMMLYHLDSPNTTPHWTEIYVIITVSTMFCEEVRRLYLDYKTRMLEQWGSTGSTLLTVSTNAFFILPYFLFFLGLGFRYQGYNDAILTTARIIWAFDLELWYLISLKFMVALKAVGPKLFMLKNMLTDLAAFVYMIVIAIAAYGVVSRSLILYKQIPFTGTDIFREIFYEPYWFIYGDVSDKDLLDEIISNGTQPLVAEATATHVILAFHMLFINILILNLLIAVFTDTIDKVKENTEFYWRYQRYSFVREYFERPPLAYPPLIIFPHLVLLFLAFRQECCPKFCHNEVEDEGQRSKSKSLTRIFKMIPVKKLEQNERWDAFENAATHSFARSIVADNKKKNASTTDDIYSGSTLSTIESDVIKPIAEQQQTITDLKQEILGLKSVLANTQKNMEEVLQNNKRAEHQSSQMNEQLKWITKAMARVKMNSPDEPPPNLKELPVDVDGATLAQTTTSSDA